MSQQDTVLELLRGGHNEEMLVLPLLNMTPSIIVPDESSEISACANNIILDEEFKYIFLL